MLKKIDPADGPYLGLGIFLAFCCLILLWPLTPPAPPPVKKAVLPPLDYLAISRDLGLVLVIPIAGHELRAPLEATQGQPLSPFPLEEPERDPYEFSETDELEEEAPENPGEPMEDSQLNDEEAGWKERPEPAQ